MTTTTIIFMMMLMIIVMRRQMAQIAYGEDPKGRRQILLKSVKEGIHHRPFNNFSSHWRF